MMLVIITAILIKIIIVENNKTELIIKIVAVVVIKRKANVTFNYLAKFAQKSLLQPDVVSKQSELQL